jgi:hypothetical protein
VIARSTAVSEGAENRDSLGAGTVVAFAMSQPEEVDMNDILFRPTRQEF